MKAINGDYRQMFPALAAAPEWTYLDSAATAQVPEVVIDAMNAWMRAGTGSPHRGAHKVSVEATRRYEDAKSAVAHFIGATDSEIVFTKNASEALNLIAYSYGCTELKPRDIIDVAITSHHSNLVPWQYVAEKTGATLHYGKEGIAPGTQVCTREGNAPCDHCGQEACMCSDPFCSFSPGTRLVTLPWVANGLGTIHDVKRVIDAAHAVGAVVVLDASQAVGHLPVDVRGLDVDFLVFSGHKMFGPMGIGVLYGKRALLEKMPPFLMGGDMIEYVEERHTTFAPVPQRFEAGTQNVLGAVGLAEAVRFIEGIGVEAIQTHERHLVEMAVDALAALPFVTVYGEAPRGSLLIFTVEGVHPHDVATLLDEKGIAIRAGHHCAQPLMQAMDLSASCRASFSIYNTEADIQRLVEGLYYVREVFGYGR